MLGGQETSSARRAVGVGSRRRASTLIELLIVIAMIGILITMLIPSLKRSMDLAKATVCQYHLRELGYCLRMYTQENDGWLPTTREDQRIAAGTPTQNDAWFTRLFPTYLQDPESLSCPKDPYGYRMEFASAQLSSPAAADYASYGLNNFIVNAGGGYLSHIDRFQPTRPLDTILVADLGPDTLRYGGGGAIGSGPTRNSSLMNWGDNFDPFTGLPPNPWLTTRHDHGINVLTLGTSIRKVKTDVLLKQRLQRHYARCSAGGCTLCNQLQVYHYSFADANLYWWTGPVPEKK